LCRIGVPGTRRTMSPSPSLPHAKNEEVLIMPWIL